MSTKKTEKVHAVATSLRTTPVVVGSNLLFFTVDDLWRSDGSEAGTIVLKKDIAAPGCRKRMENAVTNGILYWTDAAVRGDGKSINLWRSDGTAEGTYVVVSQHGSYSPALVSCRQPLVTNGHVYFAGTDELHGVEPWVSDGTPEGTRMLYDLNPGPEGSDPDTFVASGGRIYFSATEPGFGTELWSLPFECIRDCRPKRRAVR